MNQEHGRENRNPFFNREVFNDGRGFIVAAQKIAAAIKELSPDLRLREYTEPQVTLVGGFVRDALAGGQPKDADLEVLGVTPKKLATILKKLFGPEKVNDVGKSFGVLKVALPDGLELDVSIPRVDSRGDGGGHKDIKVKGDPSLSIVEAQRRRDFTINALSMDVSSGTIIDSFGGVEDLRNRVLRLVDETNFKDDPLRVLRGVQFAARFGLAVEPKTFSFMREMVVAGALDHLPADRLRGEMEKLLTKADKPSLGLVLMRDLGILERHFPELNRLIGCEQDPIYHPEGDVWTHTKLVTDAAAKLFKKRFFRPPEMTDNEYRQIQLSVMLGALLHDFGKPATTKREADGRIHSFGHEVAGLEPAKNFLRRLNVSAEVSDNVLRIVQWHRLPEDQAADFLAGRVSGEQYKKTVKRFLDKLQIDQNRSFPWPAFMVVCEADYLGSDPQAAKPPFPVLREMARAISEFKQVSGPVIRGRDVLDLWREIKGEDRPGGPWIREVTEVIKDEGFDDPEAARGRAREIIKAM